MHRPRGDPVPRVRCWPSKVTNERGMRGAVAPTAGDERVVAARTGDRGNRAGGEFATVDFRQNVSFQSREFCVFMAPA